MRALDRMFETLDVLEAVEKKIVSETMAELKKEKGSIGKLRKNAELISLISQGANATEQRIQRLTCGEKVRVEIEEKKRYHK